MAEMPLCWLFLAVAAMTDTLHLEKSLSFFLATTRSKGSTKTRDFLLPSGI